MSKKTSPRNYLWTVLIMFLVVGWFYPVIGLLALVCMTAPVVVSLLTGKRKWCAMFCPRGLFNDIILSKISRNKKAPAFLRSVYFKIGFLVFLFYNLIVGIMDAANFAEVGLVFVRIVSLTTALAIVLGVTYQQRTWCGFCPMGFLSSLMIKLRQSFTIKKKSVSIPKTAPHKVILFTSNHCPSCKEIKQVLTAKKIDFVERNIDEDKKAREVLYNRYKSGSIPTVVQGDKILKNDELNRLEIDFKSA